MIISIPDLGAGNSRLLFTSWLVHNLIYPTFSHLVPDDDGQVWNTSYVIAFVHHIYGTCSSSLSPPWNQNCEMVWSHEWGRRMIQEFSRSLVSVEQRRACRRSRTPPPTCGRRAEQKTSSPQRRSRWCVLIVFTSMSSFVLIVCLRNPWLSMDGLSEQI